MVNESCYKRVFENSSAIEQYNNVFSSKSQTQTHSKGGWEQKYKYFNLNFE